MNIMHNKKIIDGLIVPINFIPKHMETKTITPKFRNRLAHSTKKRAKELFLKKIETPNQTDVNLGFIVEVLKKSNILPENVIQSLEKNSKNVIFEIQKLFMRKDFSMNNFITYLSNPAKKQKSILTSKQIKPQYKPNSIMLEQEDYRLLLDNSGSPHYFANVFRRITLDKKLTSSQLIKIKTLLENNGIKPSKKNNINITKIFMSLRGSKIQPDEVLKLFDYKKAKKPPIDTTQAFLFYRLLETSSSAQKAIQKFNNYPLIKENIVEFTKYMEKATHTKSGELRFDELLEKFRNELHLLHSSSFFDFFKK